MPLPKPDLNGAQIASRLVGNQGLGAPKRVGAVLLGLADDASDPLANEAGILPRAHVSHEVVSTRNDEIVEHATAMIEPSKDRLTSRLNQSKLDGPLGLLLHHNCAISDALAGDDVANANLYQVTSAQLAMIAKSKSARSRSRRC
jgi:hypothetical protein